MECVCQDCQSARQPAEQMAALVRYQTEQVLATLEDLKQRIQTSRDYRAVQNSPYRQQGLDQHEQVILRMQTQLREIQNMYGSDHRLEMLGRLMDPDPRV
jgi:erythromycin esterase-like protein